MKRLARENSQLKADPIDYCHVILKMHPFESESSNLLTNPTYGHLLFMKGHPSPEWLLASLATYQVDPEFFQRHLDFRYAEEVRTRKETAGI